VAWTANRRRPHQPSFEHHSPRFRAPSGQCAQETSSRCFSSRSESSALNTPMNATTSPAIAAPGDGKRPIKDHERFIAQGLVGTDKHLLHRRESSLQLVRHLHHICAGRESQRDGCDGVVMPVLPIDLRRHQHVPGSTRNRNRPDGAKRVRTVVP